VNRSDQAEMQDAIIIAANREAGSP